MNWDVLIASSIVILSRASRASRSAVPQANFIAATCLSVSAETLFQILLLINARLPPILAISFSLLVLKAASDHRPSILLFAFLKTP